LKIFPGEKYGSSNCHDKQTSVRGLSHACLHLGAAAQLHLQENHRFGELRLTGWCWTLTLRTGFNVSEACTIAALIGSDVDTQQVGLVQSSLLLLFFWIGFDFILIICRRFHKKCRDLETATLGKW